jgi:hypothetical protein
MAHHDGEKHLLIANGADDRSGCADQLGGEHREVAGTAWEY